VTSQRSGAQGGWGKESLRRQGSLLRTVFGGQVGGCVRLRDPDFSVRGKLAVGALGGWTIFFEG